MMTGKPPKVSVIMPSYNKAEYIVESIHSILSQTWKDFELIILDDCSTDNSVEVIRTIKDSRIRFYENSENIGIAANRNKGLELAQGEYIALLDADDLSPDYRLKDEVEYLDQHPEIVAVYGGSQEIDENGEAQGLYVSTLHNPDFIRAKLLIRDVIPNGSCMYRKAFVMDNNIYYEDEYYGMDDYLFWVRCSVKGNIVGIPETLLYWRNFDHNTTNQLFDDQRRMDKYDEIHRIALELNGFILSDSELTLYNRVLSEKPYKIPNEAELQSFFSVINNLINQSKEKRGSKEWELMFKRQFGLSLEKSYVWEKGK